MDATDATELLDFTIVYRKPGSKARSLKVQVPPSTSVGDIAKQVQRVLQVPAAKQTLVLKVRTRAAARQPSARPPSAERPSRVSPPGESAVLKRPGPAPALAPRRPA